MHELWKKWAVGLDAQRAALRKMLAKAKLERHEEAILGAARVAAGFRFRVLDKKPPPLGATRAGGDPDLPSDVEWPDGQSFLMQIDLADLAAIPVSVPLPKKGLLTFFLLDGEGDEEYLTEGSVVYSAQPKSLERTKRPSKGLEKYPMRRLEIAPALTLPLPNSAIVQAFAFSDDASERYHDDVWRKFPSPRYRLGGHDDDYYAPQNVKNEHLLLALSSSDTMSFFWGDEDHLHFYVPEAAAKRAAFDAAHPRCATA